MAHNWNKNSSRQHGLYTVEFAIVGLVTFTILFGAIEVSRMLYTVNVLEEATRRGARMAVVCEVDDDAILRATVFADAGTASPILPGLTTANVNLQYLDENGAPVTGYVGDDVAYTSIRYVRVAIDNFNYDFLLPGLEQSFITDSYHTILPIESLGIHKAGERSDC